MDKATLELMQPTLTGTTVELRPLQREHAQALPDAAAHGQLWNMKLTVVPGPDTIDGYLATALAGCEAGTIIDDEWPGVKAMLEEKLKR
ncbi:hypothetical protein LMG28614_01036 [Paraburkholderia ultramafica]|uniref:Uncharacterized protein n=1 Tax=Paraburkholderia ultramafica TaxID=1544867 RepID=A0A6S7AWV2_9BURK|nr:hypothetical protein LMG28614_01036 [Paraburkholderia ultramafica]